jgi:TANFOR domain-containing protein
MYSRFNILRLHLIFLMLTGFVFPVFTMAQGAPPVTVSASVQPPFYSGFSYYVDHPEKIQVFFVNTSSSTLDVYVQGRFSGDNGIEIYSDPNYIMPQPITLYQGVPYQLTQENLGEIFSPDHILYQGITAQELMQMGALPEGNYQFCFSVYDYNTHQLVSDENSGCSNIIIISHIDPPEILNPLCGDSITATEPQNVLISWTTPVGAAPNVKYRLVMTEMHPGDRNPNDALAAASPPYFLEEDNLTVPQFLVGPSAPPLVEGRSYAFFVQAYDPDNMIVFKNNGTSEACWFTYKAAGQIEWDTTNNIIVPGGISGFDNDFKLIPPTTIHGQLRYNLASAVKERGASSGNGASGFFPPTGGSQPSGNTSGQNQNGGNANSNSVNFWGGVFSGFQGGVASNLNFLPPSGKGTIGASLYDLAGSEPLRNTAVRLVVRFGWKINDDIFNVVNIEGHAGIETLRKYRFYNLDGEEIPLENVFESIGKVLDVCTTDDQGNFNFNFNSPFFTGPFYAKSKNNAFGSGTYEGAIMLRIEVVNQKFCSPDISIFAQQGDNLEIPVQLALIKDYDMQLKVVSAYDTAGGSKDKGHNVIYSQWDTLAKAITGGKPIPGATVKVFRDMQKIKNEHPAILLSEGQKLGSVTKNNNGEFKDIFIGKTDAEGKVTITHLVKHWAITDGENQTPYYLSVQTRPENVDSAYEYTLYNFEPFFGTLKAMFSSSDMGKKLYGEDDAGNNGNSPVTYNYYYTTPDAAKDVSLGLDAANPEIKGRLMASSGMENIGISNVKVKLFEQNKLEVPSIALLLHGGDVNFDLSDDTHDFVYADVTKTNNSGFFRFKNLTVNQGEHMRVEGPYRRIQIESELYKRIVWPPANRMPLNLKYGELFFKEFQLFPKRLLKGKVVDEQGNPVSAYVRLLPNTPYVKTNPKYGMGHWGLTVTEENFEIPVKEKGNFIEILPLSNNYFPDTAYVNNYQEGQTVTFTVYRKMHHLRVHLFDEATDGVIANATVIVGDTLITAKTDKSGVAELVFPSPGQQFLVRIYAENYSPYQTSFNIPVSRAWTEKTVKIHYALHISGMVTDESTGQPIDSAMVYTRLQSTDGNTVYLETYTDKEGKYRLNGLPWYDFPTVVHIYAVKTGKNPSYLGKEKRILVTTSMTLSGFDFALKRVDDWDLSNISGMPVTIENMKARPGFGITLSGYFHSLPHHPDINTISGEKVYFKNLKVTKGPKGEIIPVDDFVTTENYSLPVKIKGGFSGKLFKVIDTPGSASDYHLQITKKGDNSLLKGGLKIDISSFGFAYDFSGEIYVGDDTTDLNIAAFKSGEQNYPSRLYLFDKKSLFMSSYPTPIANYRVFGFNASSSFKKAYLQDGTIHIGTILHTDIPLVNGKPLDLKIDAGEILITQNDMKLEHNPGNQLSFELEKWKVVSKNGWKFDRTRDAIVIPEATIFTGLGVDAGIQGLNIRPTALREGKIDLSSGLMLGDIKKLKLAKGMEPVFNYDAGVGHYRISLTGKTSGDYVAWVDNLPATNDNLEFTSIGMLSDNSTVFSLGKNMRFHDLFDVFVDQIMTGPGFFRLAGMPKTGIPGYIATRAEVTYTKENGKLKFKLEPLNGGADLNANTLFMLGQNYNDQKLTNRLFTSYGTFFIKPPPDQGGSEVEIKGFLTKTPTQCYIDVVTPQTVKMGKEKFDIIEGKISVKNNKWGELRYTAHTHSKGLKDDNVLAFSVHGGIEVNSDNVSADSIETPLGSLNISYIFPERALVGVLTIDKEIQLGFGSLNSGMMATRFDPHGFYLGFAGQITILNDTYDGGFIMGDYDADLSDVARPMLANFETNVPSFDGLTGFYLIGQRMLVNKTLPLLIIDVSVKAGIGAFVNLDLNKGMFSVGGYGFAHAKGGVNVTGCGFVGVIQDGYADIIGKYENKELSISSCQSLTTCVNACGLEGCLNFTSKIKISTGHSPEASLEINGSCNNN